MKKAILVLFALGCMVSAAVAVEIEPRAYPCPECNVGRLVERLVYDPDLDHAIEHRDCIHGHPGKVDVYWELTYEVYEECSENCGYSAHVGSTHDYEWRCEA